MGDEGRVNGHELDRFRDYLHLLARVQIDPRHRAKYGASDIVQQTLLEAHESRAQFRGSSEEDLLAWLRKILVHNLADAWRAYGRARRDVRRERSLEEAIDDSVSSLKSWLAAIQSSPSERTMKHEQLLRLAGALGELPESQREAVVLHHVRGWKLSELSAHLERSEVAVASLLHRGLKKLRTLLVEE